MATQICPKCKEDSFTWSVDEDSPLTYWGCYNCHYGAYEDESLQTNCETCGSYSKMKLKDDTTEYWWCCKCNKVSNVKPLSADT